MHRFLTPSPSSSPHRSEEMRGRPSPRSVQFAFSLNRAAKASLRVFDASGRAVTTLANGEQAAGRHVLYWNGNDGLGRRVAGGIYFARLVVESETRVSKLVLTR